MAENVAHNGFILNVWSLLIPPPPIGYVPYFYWVPNKADYFPFL